MLINKITKNIFIDSNGIFVNKVIFDTPTEVHSHDFLEICLIYSGEGIHSINGISSRCVSGDYFIINHNTPHAIYPTGKMVVYNIVFTPDFIDINITGEDIDDIFQHYLFKKLFIVDKSTIKFQAGNEIVNIFTSMYEEFNNKPIGYIEVLRSNIMLLLIFTLRMANKIKTALPQSLSKTFDEVVSYILKNYNKEIPLNKLAEIAYVSKEHLSREFKKKVGRTITDFIKELRIGEAKKLLINTSKSVSEISGIVGYGDIKYFSKIFSEMEGMPPTAYRRRLRQRDGS